LSVIGSSVGEIETPALLVDLDVLERNIARMADYFSRVDSSLRPHAKTHKSPVIAHKQVEAGSIGVCCQKLGEAEVMNAAGVDSILITNQVVEPEKIKRLVNMSKRGEVIVSVDNLDVARATSEIAFNNRVKQDVLVEVNVGINRCGVEPGEPTVNFVKELLKFRGLNFRGLLGYEGPFFNLPDFEERKAAANARNKLLVETGDSLEDAGIDVEILSAGATGTYNITGSYPGITEVEAGSYVFMDATYKKLKGLEFDVALTLLTTVISRPTRERAVVDAGMKAITQEFGVPQVKEIEGVELRSLSEEHGTLKLTNPSRELKIGDKIELVPTHCCTTVNLHDRYYCIRNSVLEDIWDIAARGKMH